MASKSDVKDLLPILLLSLSVRLVRVGLLTMLATDNFALTFVVEVKSMSTCWGELKGCSSMSLLKGTKPEL